MIEVVRRINACKRELQAHSFLAYIANDDIDPVTRLNFVPGIAPFVMGFADVNIVGLRSEPSDDRLQQLINQHTHEDDHHWPMYLDDLRTLGLDRQVSVTETLRSLWSKEKTRTRQLTYGLMALADTPDPALRIALVEAIEATGHVAWRSFLKAARAYTASTGKELRYFGPEHAELETGHAVGADDIDRELRGIELDPQQRVQAFAMVDKVFELFDAMLSEQLDYARNHDEHQLIDAQ